MLSVSEKKRIRGWFLLLLFCTRESLQRRAGAAEGLSAAPPAAPTGLSSPAAPSALSPGSAVLSAATPSPLKTVAQNIELRALQAECRPSHADGRTTLRLREKPGWGLLLRPRDGGRPRAGCRDHPRRQRRSVGLQRPSQQRQDSLAEAPRQLPAPRLGAARLGCCSQHFISAGKCPITAQIRCPRAVLGSPASAGAVT